MNFCEVGNLVLICTYLGMMLVVLVWLFLKRYWGIDVIIGEMSGSGSLGNKDVARIVNVKNGEKTHQEWRFRHNKQYNGMTPIPSGECIIPLQGMFSRKFVHFAKMSNGNLVALQQSKDDISKLLSDRYSIEATKTVIANGYDKVEKMFPKVDKIWWSTAMGVGAIWTLTIIFCAIIVLTALKNPETITQVVQVVNNTAQSGGIGSFLP